MWISSYKLIRNSRPPNWVVDKLRDYYISLKDDLIEKHEDEYNFHLEFSMHSEAAYLFIRDAHNANEYKISFRSHDNFCNHFYDEKVLLYRFKTWDKCKKYFYKKCLPRAIARLDETEQQCLNIEYGIGKIDMYER